ncbi:MAG: rhodanese-like domain-containing protein [Gemmatimonadales bacterium]|nr:rhodanese-like domain-containing protein [Gemmatimonadales bacterium]
MDTRRRSRTPTLILLGASLLLFAPFPLAALQSQPTIWQATLGEQSPVTPEITTEEMQQLLQAGGTPVLDVRSAQEYAIAHIPGSINLYEKEVEQIARAYPDKSAAIVLYCNGPFCGKSKRLSQELVSRGYTNVRRYQASRSGGLWEIPCRPTSWAPATSWLATRPLSGWMLVLPRTSRGDRCPRP